MIQLRLYSPVIPLFAAIQPYIDVRRGSLARAMIYAKRLRAPWGGVTLGER